MKRGFMLASLCIVALLVAAPPLLGAESDEELAKKTQNPVADLITVPFQNNFNFNYGPNNDLQSVLNIQPVIPIHLSEDWNLVTRTIIPVINQPWPQSRGGLGDINTSLFLSPANTGPNCRTGKLFWGVGPILQFPTATNDVLGSSNYAAGPAGVVGYFGKTWVFGIIGQQPLVLCLHLVLPPALYEFYDGPTLHQLQPAEGLVPLGFRRSLRPTGARKDRQVWTVPVGGAVGKIFRIGKIPFNANLGAYYNVVRPETIGPEWSIRAQIAILLPTF